MLLLAEVTIILLRDMWVLLNHDAEHPVPVMQLGHQTQLRIKGKQITQSSS